jgi:hypothetical protein
VNNGERRIVSARNIAPLSDFEFLDHFRISAGVAVDQ